MKKEPHILCSSKDISKYVLIVGDPARVDRIGTQMDKFEEVSYNREYKTILGRYKNVDITVTSTGIGGPSAAIAIEELISCGAECIIRLGSCGALQPDIDIGDLIIGTSAVKDDGVSNTYVDKQYPAVANFKLVNEILKIADNKKYKYHCGIVRSHDTFYTDKEEEIMKYWNHRNVLASDMETSILFILGSLRNIKTASILNNVVTYGEDAKSGVGDFVDESVRTMEGEEKQIKLGLETIYKMANNL